MRKKRKDKAPGVDFSFLESIEFATQQLTVVGIESPKLDAEILLQCVLKVPSLELFLKRHEQHTHETLEEFLALVARRLCHEPVAYIVGHKEFYGRDFVVSRACLIPRPDSEIVVEECLKRIDVESTGCIIDLCTGSGAIGLTIAKERTHISLIATDISHDALSIASENAKQLDVVERVTLRQGDLFEAFGAAKHKAALIVSNPPYIPRGDIEALSSSVKDFEPIAALDGDKDGLHFYRAILAHAASYLADEGYLVFEIGFDQAEAVVAMLAPCWRLIAVVQDLGARDRCIVLQLRDGSGTL